VESSPTGTFDSALLAGGWNLLTQAGMPSLLACQRHAIPVEVAGVYCSGLLAGRESYAYIPAPPEQLHLARQWEALAASFGHSLPAIAIAFAVLPDCVQRLVIGMATAAEVHQTFAAIEESYHVPVELFLEAAEAGLIVAPLTSLQAPVSTDRRRAGDVASTA